MNEEVSRDMTGEADGMEFSTATLSFYCKVHTNIRKRGCMQITSVVQTEMITVHCDVSSRCI